MTQKEIYQKEQELAKLKKEAWLQRGQDLLASFMPYAGKCYLTRFMQPEHETRGRTSSSSHGLLKLGTPALSTWTSYPDGHRVEFSKISRLFVHQSKSKLLVEFDNSHYDRSYERLSQLTDLIVCEVPVRVFNRHKTLLQSMGHHYEAEWQTDVTAGEACGWNGAFYTEEEHPLDIPHIQLEAYESTLLASDTHRWMLNGYRFLLTPASVHWAMDRLRTAETDLYRGSEHFQECDMGYVKRTQESIRSVRSKLIWKVE